jgi:hypothetical protein
VNDTEKLWHRIRARATVVPGWVVIEHFPLDMARLLLPPWVQNEVQWALGWRNGEVGAYCFAIAVGHGQYIVVGKKLLTVTPMQVVLESRLSATLREVMMELSDARTEDAE